MRAWRGFGIYIDSSDDEIQQAADQFQRACKLTDGDTSRNVAARNIREPTDRS